MCILKKIIIVFVDSLKKLMEQNEDYLDYIKK